MRLLPDENASWRLAAYLRPHCEAVLHVHAIGLDESPDTSIWRYARQHGYDLLTKDEDLRAVAASRRVSTAGRSIAKCPGSGENLGRIFTG